MCYSRYWDERRAEEAKAKEAEQKRTETIRTMLSDAEKRAEVEKAREPAPRQATPAK